MTNEAREPIAIVGIGCRLPGGVVDPTSMWQLLRDGVDAITPIPPDRFDVDTLYDPRPATPGRIMSRWGGFIDGIDGFDAGFFETAPREAERLDPQQRLLLETSWEALEDAGIAGDALAGSNTGVYVGMWINEYEALLFGDREHIDFHMTTGTGRYAASGRLSYFLDLMGPSVTVDTACSSSLVAIHLACQGLLSGECDLALAGGANAIVEPFITIAYSQSRMMAPDGHCKFGDAAADGYVRSDGAVMIALKRLSSAQAAGDHIYAVIRGSAVTNDGRSSGFLATPGQAGQEHMLRRAYVNAGVDPRSVQYIEAHGTGTAAGDPVELGALGAVVGASRDVARPCLVGSLKSNVGHTEGAAGAAGLVKLALALERAEVPASLHVSRPNPSVPWQQLGMRVNAQHQPWPVTDGPRRGGVSAFGIAGTNAHVVLEEAPPTSSATALPANSAPTNATAHLLVLSAAGPGALRSLADRYARMLEAGIESVADLCAAAATRRTHLSHRLTAVGADHATLAASLRQNAGVLDVGAARPYSGAAPRVVFVFPGQGSQWFGMARELFVDEPGFRRAMTECDAAISAEAGWSPIEMLTAIEQPSRLDDIDVVQPLLFSIQVSLAALWRSWGIVPDAVVGHSMGEVAAAHVAGALSLADATAVICRRSLLLRRISGQGAMALVDLPMAETAAAIAAHGATLSIAVSNSPRSTVISGEAGAVQEVLDALLANDVFCRPVKVDVASHSPQVDPLLGDLRAGLSTLAPGPTVVPFRSTVAGAFIDGPVLDGDYWAANLRQPVLFGDAVAELAAMGPTTFVELSPHPVLLPSVEQVIREIEPVGSVVASMRRGEPERPTMLAGLGALYEAGVSVDWMSVVGAPSSPVVLPTYPWQRERHWYEPSPSGDRPAGGHPLLGRSISPAAELGTVHWQTALDGDHLAFLHDHVVQGSSVLPATGFLELARAAVAGDSPAAVLLTDLRLHEALPLDAQHPREVQITLDPVAQESRRCRIWSRESSSSDGEWQLHAEVKVGRNGQPAQYESLAAIRTRCAQHRGADEHIADMLARQLAYTGAFRTVGEVWVGAGEALARIASALSSPGSAEQRIAMLDGCLQTALAGLPKSSSGQTFVPVALDRVLLTSLDDIAWSHAVVTLLSPGVARCEVTVLDSSGRVVAECNGLELRRVGSVQQRLGSLLYELCWRAAPRPTSADPGGEPRRWVVYAAEAAGNDVAARWREAGDECIVVRAGEEFSRVSDTEFKVDPRSVDDHRAVFTEIADRPGPKLAGVVYLWAGGLGEDSFVRSAPGGGSTDAETFAYLAPLAIMQALGVLASPPRLWLATRGARSAAPAQALLWGLGRVAANEQPGLRCTLIDLEPVGADERDLFDEVRSAAPDRQVSFADGVRSVARLSRAAGIGSAVPRTTLTDSYRIVATSPGSLDGLRPQAQPRSGPEPGEVEVRITAAALNFLDVLKAMGICPGFEASPSVALGAECAGVVVAAGSGVGHLRVGDEVVAITPSYRTTSMLASYVTVPAGFVQSRPAVLSPEKACAAPVAYLTAYYALCELGRVRAGERVLVHSATGGVGLAALEICRLVGAEVIATAGSPQKRAHLQALGIEHVLDSRTTAFARQVREITAGRGVDLVLNSLPGDAIPAGLSVLAPRGRFLELGKSDVYAHRSLDLAVFKNNLALFVVDLAGLTEQDPRYVAEMFREVVAMLADGRLPPLPTTATSIESAADAFRTMAQAAHIGKLVLTVPTEPIQADVPLIRADATYLVTGGTGALGLAVAQWLVDHGARHLALMARRQPSPAAELAVASMRACGADVRLVLADVSDAAEVHAAVAALRTSMPPLRGVFHAAGVLADATIGGMDTARSRAALSPKLHGGWNLHEATLDDPLDQLVLFSSVAAVLGLAGQSNYAAGNAFLDALAAHRRAGGRPGLSIEWGPWATIGLAASASNRGERLAERGLGSLDPADALDVLELLLAGGDANVAVMCFDAGRWSAAEPAVSELISELVVTSAAAIGGGPALRERLLAVPAGARRRRAMEDGICAEVAPVLRVVVQRLDRQQPLKAMGLDSLMALELRNRLEHATGLTLSATIVWNYPTVTVLADHLASLMGIALEPDSAGGVEGRTGSSGPSMSEASTASQAELEAMLLDELAAVDRLLDVDGSSS